MKRPGPAKILTPHDYATALKDAVSWLGERYLLAEPAPRRPVEPKPFFAATRNWHESPRPRLTRH
jgi:hypothetical protein